MIAWISLLAACVACAAAPPASWTADRDHPAPASNGPGAVFPSVRDAALDALATAHRTATPRDQERLRVGTIRRVAHGYSYSAPRRAVAASSLMPQSVRYDLHPSDVASYLIPPHTSEWPRNHSNRTSLSEARRIVDDLDPAHRPVYVLTESLEIVSYTGWGHAQVVARLNRSR